MQLDLGAKVGQDIIRPDNISPRTQTSEAKCLFEILSGEAPRTRTLKTAFNPLQTN